MKILHVGDLQLGYNHYGSKVRGDDVFVALNKVLEIGVANDVAAILFAGDLFEYTRMLGGVVRRSRRVFAEFKAKHPEIRLLAIDGNHDAGEGAWPEVLGLECVDGVIGITTLTRDGEAVNVVMMNYCPAAEFDKHLQAFAPSIKRVPGQPPPLIFMMHYPLGDMVPFGSVVTAKDTAPVLAGLGIRYVALGDIHNYAETNIVTDHGVIDYVYPGSIEITDINEDWPKSVVLLETGPGTVKHTRIKYEVRPILRAVINTEEDYTAFADKLSQIKATGVVPVVEAVTNADIVDLHSRMVKLTRGMPVSLTSSPKSVVKHEWDRKSAKTDLVDVVAEFYKPDTVEFELITAILKAPENLDTCIRAYITKCGCAR